MIERLIASPWSPCQRTASSRPPARPATRPGSLAGVVGLELVDIVARTRAAPRSPPAAAPADRPRAASGRACARGRRRRAPSNTSPSTPSRTDSGSPPSRGTTSGTRAARHSAAASGAQSHHSEGSATASTSRSSVPISLGAKAPVQLDDAARVERAQLLGEAAGHLADGSCTSQRAPACAGPPRRAAAGPCAGRPSRGTRRSAARRRAPGRRSRPTCSQISLLVRHRLAHDVDQVRVVARARAASARTASETARIAVRPRSARARISASRRRWPSVSWLPDARRRSAPPSPGPAQIAPGAGQQIGARADQPVVVGREVGGRPRAAA